MCSLMGFYTTRRQKENSFAVAVPFENRPHAFRFRVKMHEIVP